MATRNPASVLPDPVGAATSVSLPAAIRGQLRACGSVGPSGKRCLNQALTAGWNPSTASEPLDPASISDSSVIVRSYAGAVTTTRRPADGAPRRGPT